jgi:hypothetical protein
MSAPRAAVGVNLSKPRQAVLPKVLTRLAHRRRGHVVVTRMEVCLRNGHGGHDAVCAEPESVEIRDSLYGSDDAGELVEEPVPQELRYRYHRSVLGSSGQ